MGCRRYAFILTLADEPQQCLDAVAPNAGNDAKLSHVSPDRIDQCRTLANKQLPGPVQYQYRLLLTLIGTKRIVGR